MNREAETRSGGRNEDLFIAGVKYLAVKYRIDNYTVITKNSYHTGADDYTQLEVQKQLIKLFQK